ncbi:MAG: GDP-mannose 4,6-dehydratase [Lachnospiraceae bacterium]|nr:GDP-mannose 4,6-dehydratase [Lachnospiraceae bacterium]
MKVLVTGGTGMVGSHFMNSYKNEGAEVYGIARNSASSRMAAVQDQSIIRCDILERDRLMQIFMDIRPEVVIHMAAQAFNGDSWNSEYVTHSTNYQGTLNVLYCARALRDSGVDVKVLLACSSAEYGNITPEDCPLVEDRLLTPWTPYGVSKAGVEMLGRQYQLNFNMNIFLPRMFIHVGTGHPPATAIQNFARQLALIKKGILKPEIHVGNLTSARDFIDVRDGVAAMRLLLEKGNPGEPVNICNNKAYKISEILDMLVEISGTNAEVISDPALFRVADEPLLLGDNSKIVAMGYERRYTMYQTLEDVFADWMERC